MTPDLAPAALANVLALDALWPVIATTTLAGVVYGFAGFGAALVFLPVASSLIEPRLAIAAFSLSALSSLFTLVPRAWSEMDRKVTLAMTLTATLTLPVGILLLKVLDPRAVQIAISVFAALTLAILIAGFRFRVRPGLLPSVGVAGAAGVMGGATGLLGPVVILFNLSSGDDARRMRANTLIFLTLASLFVVPQMALQGLISAEALWLGAVLFPAYGLGNIVGRGLFNPAHEGLYRYIAYAIIGASVLLGLPIFG
ncbi:MAG: sulfite exporter TauE/SafE family protein [Pseudomonadota bacterium]